jgi:hypothetical protein
VVDVSDVSGTFFCEFLTMKHVLAAALTMLSVVAHAGSPEETYLAARDGYIAKLNPAGDTGAVSDAVAKDEERARADLAKQLRAMIGPLNVKGYDGEGALTIETLFKSDVGFGGLDGLVFTAPKDISLVVTPRGLFERWVRDHKDWWGPTLANVPQEPLAALKTEAFYTQGISADAAVSSFGELPLSKPADAVTAYAMLAIRRQDIGPSAPDEILVSVIVGQRLYVVSAPVSTELKLMPACEAIWTEAQTKSNKILEAYSANDRKDDKLFDEHSRVQEQGDAAMRQCFAERIRSDAAFSGLTKQAQAIVDQLTAK